MPPRDLLAVARAALRERVMARLDGEGRYEAAMVANAMAIAIRELELGPAARAEEHDLLGASTVPRRRAWASCGSGCAATCVLERSSTSASFAYCCSDLSMRDCRSATRPIFPRSGHERGGWPAAETRLHLLSYR